MSIPNLAACEFVGLSALGEAMLACRSAHAPAMDAHTAQRWIGHDHDDNGRGLCQRAPGTGHGQHMDGGVFGYLKPIDRSGLHGDCFAPGQRIVMNKKLLPAPTYPTGNRDVST